MSETVEQYLHAQLKKKGTLLFALVDSEISGAADSSRMATLMEGAGVSAILVGGSSATNQTEMTDVVDKIKQSTKLPVILFPGNVTGIVPSADAILFSSLMNSENPYYITQAQALGAPDVLRFGLEALPTAYLIIGDGTSAWFVGSARGIPHEKPKIAAAYSLAAQFLGMRFVYLEAGSGAKKSVTPEMVAAVRKVFGGFLIVGGGIRDTATAKRLARAGADALVIGTLLEKADGTKKLGQITKAINSIRRTND